MAATAVTRRVRRSTTDDSGWELAEVATQVGVKPHVLRYWEGEFPALRSEGGPTARRLYRAEDVELFQQIKHLLHTERLTVAGARRRLGALRSAERRPALRRDSGGVPGTPPGPAALAAIRDELEALRRLLA